MLIGVLVRQRGKDAKITSEAVSAGKSGTAVSAKPGSQSSSSSSGQPGSHWNTASSSSKPMAPVVSRDPRLAKFAAREATVSIPGCALSCLVSLSENCWLSTVEGINLPLFAV